MERKINNLLVLLLLIQTGFIGWHWKQYEVSLPYWIEWFGEFITFGWLRPAHHEYKKMGAWFRCLCSPKIDVSIASSSLRLHHIHVLVNFFAKEICTRSNWLLVLSLSGRGKIAVKSVQTRKILTILFKPFAFSQKSETPTSNCKFPTANSQSLTPGTNPFRMKRHNHCLPVWKFLPIEYTAQCARLSQILIERSLLSQKDCISSLRHHNDNEKATSHINMPYSITNSIADILCQSLLSHLFCSRISKKHTDHVKDSWWNSEVLRICALRRLSVQQ